MGRAVNINATRGEKFQKVQYEPPTIKHKRIKVKRFGGSLLAIYSSRMEFLERGAISRKYGRRKAQISRCMHLAGMEEIKRKAKSPKLPGAGTDPVKTVGKEGKLSLSECFL